MKKVIGVAAFAVLGMIALSSCKKDYNCVDSNGNVIGTCLKCNKAAKATFTTTCSSASGTVVKK